jgi:hypothetical protein
MLFFERVGFDDLTWQDPKMTYFEMFIYRILMNFVDDAPIRDRTCPWPDWFTCVGCPKKTHGDRRCPMLS